MKWSISEAINPNNTSNDSASKDAELHNSSIWLAEKKSRWAFVYRRKNAHTAR